MLIIPSIDILDDKLVRLEKGKYEISIVYSEDPFEVAERFASYGFNLLHLVDLTGSRSGKINIFDLIIRFSQELKLKINFGGGIRSVEDVELLFGYNVNKIVIGSLSVIEKPLFEKIISRFGVSNIICAIDSSYENLKVRGWTDQTYITIQDHIAYCQGFGIDTFLCTDIERDGMLYGPNLNLYKKLAEQFPDIQVIASGGVSSIEDVKELKSIGLYAVVIGKAIYENKIDLKELAELAR